MRRFVPALLVAAALVAVGGAVTAYLTLVRPLRVLPRPLAQIEADWDDVSRRLPPVPEAEAVDPALLELVDRFLDDEQRADATRELTRWLRRNDVPDPGCTLLADDGPSPISTMRWYEVGKHLGEEVDAHAHRVETTAVARHRCSHAVVTVGEANQDSLQGLELIVSHDGTTATSARGSDR